MIGSGLYTPLITPFRNNQLDEEGLRQHIGRQHAVSGLVLLGTTGEAATLTDEEKRRIVAIAQESGKPLIIGCTHPHTATLCTLLSRYAEGDAFLISPPSYIKPTQEGLYRHFSEVAEKSPKPIILYNHPARTGVNLEPSTIARLAKNPQFIGIKECNIAQAPHTIATGLPVFAGDDAWILPLIALGAVGAIAAGANVAPNHFHALVQAALKGNLEEARTQHTALLPLFEAGGWESNPSAYKAMMEMRGYSAGVPRSPLLPFTDPTRLEKIVCALDS